MNEEKNLFKEFPPVSTEEWEKIIERDLKGADYKQKLKWQTGEGIEALPFYRKEAREQGDKALLSAGHHWKICQRIYEQDVKAANQSACQAVEGGAGAVSFQVEMRSVAGNMGPDMQGIIVQSKEDFSQLLKSISMEEIELHFNVGMLSPIFIGMLLNECEDRRIDASKMKCTFGYDPFSFILKRGRLPLKKRNLEEAIQQVVEGCRETPFHIQPLRVDAGMITNAGATIIQELGYALAAGSEYLAMLSEKKNKIGEHPPESLSNSSRDSIPLQKGDASAIHFNFAVSGSYFLEIAKFRAARRLWDQILDAYEADKTDMVIHAVTANWNKSKAEPHTNIIRETTEAMAAAIGGCDTITVQPFDAIQKEPDEFSNRIARNTQIILKEEAWFGKVSDPSAGSWYIETLTDKIAEAAWSVFQEIEQEGGLLQSIKNGTLQTAIAESRNKRAALVENEEQVFVGMNKYIAEENEESEEVLPGKKSVSMNQTDDGANIDSNNLISSIKEALNNGAAIGDIAPALFDLNPVQIEPIKEFKVDENKT